MERENKLLAYLLGQPGGELTALMNIKPLDLLMQDGVEEGLANLIDLPLTRKSPHRSLHGMVVDIIVTYA